MSLVLLELGTLLLTLASFAGAQAVAKGQPWTAQIDRLGKYARPVARSTSLLLLMGACLLMVPTLGWIEALLFTTLALVFAASVFVLLAPIYPRIAWRAAALAPALALATALATRWLP